MRDTILKALEDKYNADISEAEANLKIYLENPVGVAEHPDIIETIEKELKMAAEYQDVLDMIPHLKK